MSKTQIEALAVMSETEWRCAYELRCSMATLSSLSKLGLVEKRGSRDFGALFSPRTAIEWRKRVSMTTESPIPSSAQYHRCPGCGRRLKIHRKEEVSGVALYVNGHKGCVGSSARVIEWLPPNGQVEIPEATK